MKRRLKWPSAQAWWDFLIAVFTGLLMLFTLWQYELSRSAQRAAVYLGLPNGQVADFNRENDPNELALYFRNYGASAAENTVIETWTMNPKSGEMVEQCVPKFQGFNPKEQHIPGIPMPPGFPYISHLTFSEKDRQQVESGQYGLRIIGRISYFDAFGGFCQPFAIDYMGNQEGFAISPSPSPDFCDTKKGHGMVFGSMGSLPTEAGTFYTKPLIFHACP
jgi:hypothetical protein